MASCAGYALPGRISQAFGRCINLNCFIFPVHLARLFLALLPVTQRLTPARRSLAIRRAGFPARSQTFPRCRPGRPGGSRRRLSWLLGVQTDQKPPQSLSRRFARERPHAQARTQPKTLCRHEGVKSRSAILDVFSIRHRHEPSLKPVLN